MGFLWLKISYLRRKIRKKDESYNLDHGVKVMIANEAQGRDDADGMYVGFQPRVGDV